MSKRIEALEIMIALARIEVGRETIEDITLVGMPANVGRVDADTWLRMAGVVEEARLPSPADREMILDLMGVYPTRGTGRHSSGHGSVLRVLAEYNGSRGAFQPKFPRTFRNSTSGV